MCMAQAWHRLREQLELVGGVEAKWWRASEYRVNKSGDDKVLEAARDSLWKRFTLFDSYRPSSNMREVKAGPHLLFLNLKGLYEQQKMDRYKERRMDLVQ